MPKRERGDAPKGKLVVALARCQGCQACMVACSLVHEGQVIPSLARLHVVLDPFQAEHVIRYCHQCRQAPCLAACPQEAISRSEETGACLVDETLCVGCGDCVEACPFDVIKLHSTSHTALICDLCQGQPACVESCPTGALAWQVVADKVTSKA